MKEYQAVQKIHKGHIPRVGGLIMFASLSFLYFSENKLLNSEAQNFFLDLYFPLLCFGFFSLKEDFYHNVNPYTRLISLFIAAILFFYIAKPLLPFIEIPILIDIINNPIILTIILVISIVTIANGFNMIDGANGLSIMVAFVILFNLSVLSLRFDDFFILNICIILIWMIIVLLLFNYPFGTIFMGDSGAYFFGFICSVLTILFYGRHPELSDWGAILILIYPLSEVLFSFTRKIFSNKLHPFYADRKHVHILFFDFFLSKGFSYKLANNLVMPSMILLWGFPAFSIPYLFESATLIIIALIIYFFLYLLHYFLLIRVSSPIDRR